MSAVKQGNGLSFFGGWYADVRDVAIGGFPENGIDIVDVTVSRIERSWLGVDATGLTALPNGYRGVQVTGGDVLVSDSVLSGNRRAGGFFWTGHLVEIRRNLVGVGADGVTPIGNGASGLFFHYPYLLYWSARVFDNIIANPGHVGIGLSLYAVGHFARNVIRNNVHGAIDIGLDGPTLQTRRGNPGQGGVQGPPTIDSAPYENDTTVIEGRIAERAGSVLLHEEVWIYANTSLHPSGFAGDDPAPGTSEIGPPRLVE